MSKPARLHERAHRVDREARAEIWPRSGSVEPGAGHRVAQGADRRPQAALDRVDLRARRVARLPGRSVQVAEAVVDEAQPARRVAEVEVDAGTASCRR